MAAPALGCLEFGSPTGPPILYFHGWPQSRLEVRFLEVAAARSGVRLLALDRPGFGRSPFQPRRRLLDWPRQVAAWADSLGLGRFAVLGFSGGGPYALACARAIPERLTAVGVVSSMVPPEAVRANPRARPPAQLGLVLARRVPWLARLLWRRAARDWRERPEDLFARMLEKLPPSDRLALALRRTILIESIQDALAPGARGAVLEAGLYARPWEFGLSKLGLRVRLWHGEDDRNVPPALARWVANAIPSCDAAFLPGEGHFSTVIRQGADVLRALGA